ncbi:histidine kinase [Streptomyces sp. NPDC059743]|uniref:histidine kinase n=1 Tax=Streptomyces sp. NPDC059743 TaxID=3346928 RepID=UPI00364D2595
MGELDGEGAMSGLTGWWHGKSKPVKVEIYTRWSLYLFGVMELALIGVPSLTAGHGPLGGWLFLLVCLQAALCCLLQSRALDWRLGRRERPVRLVLAVAVASAEGALAALVLRATDVITDDSENALLLVGFAVFGLASVAMGLRTHRQMVYAVLGTVGGTAAITLVLSMPARIVVGNVLGVALAGTALVFTYVISAWLLKAVWDLDAARELQTRLAVAEERLRFGRDLHDVMGRNLAVIALKSELAVQLAERGRPEAVAQMAEVQRIARESQREVRDVVRGYREADLYTELEGARGVLTAAGIDCLIEGADRLVGGDSGRGGTGGLSGDSRSGLPAEVQSALGWVVREATTNVLRHGDARRCTVRLSESEENGQADADGREAVLVVENDGVPVDAMASAEPIRNGSNGGSGLAGLRERLAALDGTLDARHTGQGCFRLTARVPLPASGPERPGHGPGLGHGPGHGSVSAEVVAV